MSEPRDLTFFRDPDVDRAVGLVFEIAAQLHVERQRRMALETALVNRGLLTSGEIEALVGDDGFVDRARDALDASLRKLLRIVTERGGPEGPLRDEALDGD